MACVGPLAAANVGPRCCEAERCDGPFLGTGLAAPAVSRTECFSRQVEPTRSWTHKEHSLRKRLSLTLSCYTYDGAECAGSSADDLPPIRGAQTAVDKHVYVPDPSPLKRGSGDRCRWKKHEDCDKYHSTWISKAKKAVRFSRGRTVGRIQRCMFSS